MVLPRRTQTESLRSRRTFKVIAWRRSGKPGRIGFALHHQPRRCQLGDSGDALDQKRRGQHLVFGRPQVVAGDAVEVESVRLGSYRRLVVSLATGVNRRSFTAMVIFYLRQQRKTAAKSS